MYTYIHLPTARARTLEVCIQARQLLLPRRRGLRVALGLGAPGHLSDTRPADHGVNELSGPRRQRHTALHLALTSCAASSLAEGGEQVVQHCWSVGLDLPPEGVGGVTGLVPCCSLPEAVQADVGGISPRHPTAIVSASVVVTMEMVASVTRPLRATGRTSLCELGGRSRTQLSCAEGALALCQSFIV